MNNLAIIALLVLSACGTVPEPQTPAQSVFLAHKAYQSALVVEVKYAQLSRCPATPICSDKALVAKVKGISNATYTALLSAQKTVRTPGFGDYVLESAATAATNAANAFTGITNDLKKTMEPK